MAARMTIVTRLSEALSRNGRFAVTDKVLDVGIALERMYVPSEGRPEDWNAAENEVQDGSAEKMP